MKAPSKAASTKSSVTAKERKPSQDPKNLVWIDLEMSGLSATDDVILQIAAVITNSELQVLGERAWDIWQPEEKLSNMSPFVRSMHEKTGLLAKSKHSQTDLGRAERELLELVASHCPYQAVLCGNSVWQDRVFIDRYLPGLARYLHYRLLDVSTLKVLAKLWYGESSVYVKSETGKHDAVIDIKNSIAELRHYRETLFRTP